MAGDWIKMRVDLSDDPAVIAMAQKLGVDEYAIVGRLHKLWSWADKHCSSGHAKSVTNVWIDRYVCHEGFAASMISEGWLSQSDTGITFPKFDKHNGKSAKTRAEASDRKRLEREKKENDAEMSQEKCDKSVTREEKRREDIKPSPIPPDGGKPVRKSGTINFPEFMTRCREAGERAMPDDHPVFAYANDAGIPREFLELHWYEFKDRYADGLKKYKDWRKVFSNSVRGNWFRLWYAPKNSDGYQLTTDGVQAQNVHKDKSK